jgi:uncharacterized protein (TIGR02118 family)
MARVVAMYKPPKDPVAFDKYYFATHVPIAKRIPGLRKYEVSRGAVASPAGASGVHLVAILHFDDMAVIERALTSPEGQATVADLQNFATGGVGILMFDQREV